MYNLTDTQKAFIKANTYQQVEIKVYDEDTLVTTITNANIIEGSCTINRYSSSASKLSMGCVSSAELNFSLFNSDGTFDDVSFENCKLVVSTTCGTITIPLGIFYVDEVTKTIDRLNVVALDGMILLDEKVEYGTFSFPATITQIMNFIATKCGIEYEGEGRVNTTYVVSKKPTNTEITYRNLLSWCCEIMGVGCYHNYNGKYKLDWYDTDNDNVDIDESDRFSSKLNDEEVTVSGVALVLSSGQMVSGDESGLVLKIEGNQLLQEAYNVAIENLYNLYNGFTFRPFEATVLSMPYVWCYDKITYIKEETEYVGYCTDITYTLNSNMAIACKAEKGDSATNGVTKAMSTLISSVVTEGQVQSMIEQSAEELRAEIDEVAVVHNYTIDDDEGNPIQDSNDDDLLSVVYDGAFAEMQSQITQNANSISLKIDKTEYTGEHIVSLIEQTPEEIKLSADKIKLEGTVTANETFKIDEDGTMSAEAGNIGNWKITSGNITAHADDNSELPKLEATSGTNYNEQNKVTIQYGMSTEMTYYSDMGDGYVPHKEQGEYNGGYIALDEWTFKETKDVPTEADYDGDNLEIFQSMYITPTKIESSSYDGGEFQDINSIEFSSAGIEIAAPVLWANNISADSLTASSVKTTSGADLDELNTNFRFTCGTATANINITRQQGYRNGRHVHLEVYATVGNAISNAMNIPLLMLPTNVLPKTNLVGVGTFVANPNTFPTYLELTISNRCVYQRAQSNIASGSAIAFIIDYMI